MTNEQFAALVEKLEAQSAKHPKLFKAKILLLALSSYGYIWFTLLIAAMLSFFTILLMVSERRINAGSIKMAIITTAFVFTLLKALWIKNNKPYGYYIQENAAPELYKTVRNIEKELKAPKVDAILLTDEFNAAMLQQPRLGPLGRYKNYLILGLPLMQTLSKEEFDSVIAHELGHLSKAHSKFSGWTYRVRISWFQVIQQLQEKQSRALFIFRNYFKWFIPKFDAYSFVLARQNEYVADSLAASYVGHQITGDALVRIHTVGATIEKFWTNHYQLAQHEKECIPPYKLLHHFIKDQSDLDHHILRKCQLVETGYTDTHPSLKERLNALNYEESIPGIPEKKAAEFYLNNMQEDYIKGFDQEWIAMYKEKWSEEFQNAQEVKNELHQLDNKEEALTAEEALKRVNLYYRLYGEEKSIPEFLKLVENYPEHRDDPVINYNIGKILLDANDDHGIHYIERTMKLDWGSRYNCLSLLHYYYQIKNDDEKIKEINDQFDKWSQSLKDSDQEISTLSSEQKFFAVENEGEIEKLHEQLANYEAIEKAYYAKWPLKSVPDRQIRILGIKLKDKQRTKESYQAYRKQLLSDIDFSYETYVFILNLEEELALHVATVKDSLIYNVDMKYSQTG